MGNVHRCAAQVKIEIRDLELGGYFLKIYFEPYEPQQHKNSKILKIKTTLIYI